jgi:hypothetical protein
MPSAGSKAMTAPSWPSIGGAHAQAYADGLECAEGRRWPTVSYDENVATPTVFLVGWPGRPIGRRSRMSRPSAPCAILIVVAWCSALEAMADGRLWSDNNTTMWPWPDNNDLDIPEEIN